MAHIPDGVLTAPVLVAGAAVTVIGCAYALKKLDADKIPQVAVLSAVFFIASLIHFPVGPSSVHLMLNGLIGTVLGWAAFPAILIALILQMLMFGFGGVVALGVNVMNMAVPAVLCGIVFRCLLEKGAVSPKVLSVGAGVCGAMGVLLTSLSVAISLGLSGQAFLPAAKLVVVANIPVTVIEGVLTAAAIGLIIKVKPELAVGPLAKVTS